MLGFGMPVAPSLYLFRCGVDGSGGMNVGDLRGGVGRWDGLWCKLSRGGGGGGGGGGVFKQSGVALWSRCRLGAAHKEINDLHRHNQLDAIKGTVYFKNKQPLSCDSQSDDKILSKKHNRTVSFQISEQFCSETSVDIK